MGSSLLKEYYQLSKPGIVYGNALYATAGFLLAAKGHIHVVLFIRMLFGISLVVASACAFNNYLDRDLDKKMARTKKRPSVSGVISGPRILRHASLLLVIGIVFLAFTNLLTMLTALFGFVMYVVVYDIAKRHSWHGAEVGSVSGAVPPVVGYLAVTGHFDTAALLLFVILVCWQMPHFYAIAIYRREEYEAAGVPVLPAVRGVRNAKLQIASFIVAFTLVAPLMTIFGYTGVSYLVIMLAVSIYWLYLALRGFKTADDNRWARQIFGFSLVTTLVLSLMLAVGPLLP